MIELTHISLFTRIGGIDLAAEWAGFKTILMVENNAYCQKVLKKHWPDVPIIGDIKDVTKEKVMAYAKERSMRNDSKDIGQTNREGNTLDNPSLSSGTKQSSGGSVIPPITLITGGFPCQPVSQAGKRRGKEDDRWLWPEMLRVISEIRPTWVVAENVAGLASMVEWDSVLEVDDKEYTEEEMAESYLSVGEVRERRGRGSLDEILESLKSIGYEVQTFELPACAVNAPHRRDRIFIVGRAKESIDTITKNCDGGRNTREMGRETQGQEDVWPLATDLCEDAPDTEGARLERSDSEGDSCTGGWPDESGQREWQADWWATEPDVGRVAYGIPSRVDRLKCLGNAVVPQQIYPILKAIADIEKGQA